MKTKTNKKEITVIQKMELYAGLKNEIEVLESKLIELKPDILKYVEKNGKQEVNDREFSIRLSTKYGYSDAVIKLENELEAMKKTERETNMCKSMEVNPSLVVKKI